MKLSICITVKNRAEQLKNCIASLEQLTGIDEIVVSDWHSDDTDFAWFKHKLVQIDEPFFSVGRGKNVAAEHATGDIVFFLDADIRVPQEVITRLRTEVANGNVYAPIMRMQNEDGSLAEWAVHSFGQVALLRQEYLDGEHWQNWTSYGGEDNLFIAQYQHRLVREMINGFIHQWHPHALRERYSESAAYTDLDEFKKGYRGMKIFAHDPRYKLTGRYNSISDAVVVREIFCENVYEVFDGDFTDTGIAVDIGANIGAFTLFAASLGAKKVISVEPEPHNIELLEQNIADHKDVTPNCEFIIDKRGVGGSIGTALINDKHGDSSVVYEHSSTMNTPAGKEEFTTSIRMTSLDALFADHGLEYIDVLKIDIEGLEGAVILGASERTMNLCRYITMEYDEHADDLGAIVEKISKTHQIKFVGAHGGMLFAKRY